MEENGKISFLPAADKRPVNANDLNIKPIEDDIVTNIIIDGKVMMQNLTELGFDEPWLYTELQKQGITKIDNVFLATYNGKDLSAYLANKNQN